MATIPARLVIGENGGVTVTWPAMGGTDDGQPVDLSIYPDITVHVYGTFGGATVVLQGGNAAGQYVGLNDRQDLAPISFATNPGIARTLENPKFVRPLVTGGTGSAINVVINAA